MNVQDLIDRLEKLPKDAEVLIAHQPNYPLASTIWGVGYRIQADLGPVIKDGVVFITEGTQIGYASHTLWDENSSSTWKG